MPVLPQFVRAEAVLKFEQVELTALAGVLKASPPAALVHNVQLSTDKYLVLLTPTGSSAVLIEPRQATLKTRYFHDFVGLTREARAERRRYMLEKMRALFTMLDSISFSPTFLGLVSTVRVAARTSSEIAELRQQAARSPGIKTLSIQPDGPWHDFLFRTSAVAQERYFENVQAAWYEERTHSIVGSSELASNYYVNEWEMAVESEGVEVAVDVNNKRAMIMGQRGWKTPQYFEMVDYYYDNEARLVARGLAMAGLESTNG